MDKAFKVLADGNCRQLLDKGNTCNGQTLRELCSALHTARQSVSTHRAIVEAANLVTIAWVGRAKLDDPNAAPINDIAERLEQPP